MKLVLASRSPQRDAILRQLRFPFRVVVSRFDERLEGADPEDLARANARGKAFDVVDRARRGDHGAHLDPGELVLGVDTIVVLGGRVYGKADDEGEARDYVSRLAGQTHTVISGLCLTDGERVEVDSEATEVTFHGLDADAVDRYVATGEWRDRAGAYAIQGIGSGLVARVDGDFWNVVGLPVPLLFERLDAFGVPPFSWL